MDVSTPLPIGIHHPVIQRYLAVKRQHGSTDHLACIEGCHMLTQALEAQVTITGIFLCPEMLRSPAARDLAERIFSSSLPSYIVSAKVMQRLVDWDGPDGLAALVQLPQLALQDIRLQRHSIVVVLDRVANPGNIGTIIRSADGAGADAIILTDCHKHLSHPQVIHASMGSVFSFPVVATETSEAIAWLKRHNFKIVTTDTAASLHYRQADYTQRIAIVMGNERHGIAPIWHEIEDISVSIPMNGRADSLNVGNAAVLMLYEALYQQRYNRA